MVTCSQGDVKRVVLRLVRGNDNQGGVLDVEYIWTRYDGMVCLSANDFWFESGEGDGNELWAQPKSGEELPAFPIHDDRHLLNYCCVYYLNDMRALYSDVTAWGRWM